MFGYDIKSTSLQLPYRKDDINLLHENGKILSDYQIANLTQRLQGMPNTYYPPHQLGLTYGVIKTGEKQFYVETPILLGKGASGVVHSCQATTGKWYISKVICNESYYSKNVDAIKKEHKALIEAKMSTSDSIVEYKIPGTNRKKIYMIMEQEEDGIPLYDYFINKKEIQKFSLLKKVYFALLIFNEIYKKFHSKNLLHRDLKLENILISLLGAHIIDFGMVCSSKKKYFKLVGTDGYMAPELKASRWGAIPYSQATDVYAAGVIFKELLAGNNSGLNRKTNQIVYPTLDSNLLPPELIKLVDDMTSPTADNRPTIIEAIAQLNAYYSLSEFESQREEIEKEKKSLLAEEKIHLDYAHLIIDKRASGGVTTTKLVRDTIKDYTQEKGFFRWTFGTSNQTKEIINILYPPKITREKYLKEIPELRRDSERYKKAKEYVLNNSNRTFARMLYKNIFRGKDLEVDQAYEARDIILREKAARPFWKRFF